MQRPGERFLRAGLILTVALTPLIFAGIITANTARADAAISIEAFVNGDSAAEPPGPTIEPGTTFEWTVVVTNTGVWDLEVSYTDLPDVDAFECDPVFLLGPGESATCTMSATAADGQHSGTACVEGLPMSMPMGREPVQDCAVAHYFGGSGQVAEPEPTDTPAATATPEPTSTPTAVPTNTPDPTPTSIPASTPTSAPTSTPAPTDTPAATPTSAPTSSPTSAPTFIPTNTPAATPSSIPVSTPENTPVSVPAQTATASPTSTPDDTIVPVSNPIQPKCSRAALSVGIYWPAFNRFVRVSLGGLVIEGDRVTVAMACG